MQMNETAEAVATRDELTHPFPGDVDSDEDEE